MKHVSVIALFCAVSTSAVHAQSTAFNGQDAASDRVEAVQDSISDAADRDVPRFGNSGRKLGWDGSISGRATATSGNTDTVSVGIGGRLGYFDGTNGHRLNFALSYGEEDGVENERNVLFSYDYTREFGSNLYAYGQLQTAFSEFGSYTEDHFLGFGIGYHAINTPNTQWSIQTGPGFRRAETAEGVEIEEGAWSLGSQFSTTLVDNVWLYNDTDVLYSEADVFTTNELGISVGLSDALALRTSLTTKHHSEPEPGFKPTDNTLGVSVVYNFN